jgi:Zn-dependent protease
VANGTGLGAPAERNDPGAVRIGSIAGIDVMVRTSWLLVAALIAYVAAPGIEQVSPGLGALKYVAGVAFAVLLTLSLLLHEISHAVMAQRFGLPVRSITLHFIGGVTAIEKEPTTPKQAFWISAVGPLTSLALGGAFWALYLAMPQGLLEFVVGALAGTNLLVGVLNLVPGMPLDGGLVLRSAIWKLTGNQHRGTLVAGWSGRVVALLMLLSPAIMQAFDIRTGPTDYLVALLLGWFLWTAASQAIMSAKVRARLPALRARPLARRTLAVPDDLPLAEAIRRAQEAQAGSIVTTDTAGRPVGLVNEAAVIATPQDRRPWLPTSAVARTLDPGLSLPADIGGEELIRAMQESPASEYLLVEPDGSVYGVLTTQDVDRAFAATG